MSKFRYTLVLAALGAVSLFFSLACAEEAITITTYYPSPQGVYKKLRLYPDSTAPAACVSALEGTVRYNATSHNMELCSGSPLQWQAAGGSAAESYWVLNTTTNNLYNNNTGNVGINITAPAYTLHVNGSFAAQYKNFEIPHPLDPQNKVLVHSSLEGPEHAVYYRGQARLTNGAAQIVLPEYFEALTSEQGRSVLLTPFGGSSVLFVDGPVRNSMFVVKTDKRGNRSQEFFWEVKAVRKDVAPLKVERQVR